MNVPAVPTRVIRSPSTCSAACSSPFPRTLSVDYERAAVEENILGRATYAGRARTFRYLRELYLLDLDRLLFRALRDLWDEDQAAQPLLACLVALARDASFRATATAILPVSAGTRVTADDLTAAVEATFPGVYNKGTAAKIGRNTASSWTQSGHLSGRAKKIRVRAEARPVSVTLGLLLGHLQGLRGEGLLESYWIKALDVQPADARDLAWQASRRGFLELKAAGGVTEVGFSHLLRPPVEKLV